MRETGYAHAVNHDSLLDSLRHADVVPSVSGSVAQQLLGMLLGEHMSAGDRLPSERKLTEALGVGRSAVREAIAALEVLGIVVTRAGSGTYLRSSTSELLPQTLSWSMLIDQDRMEELAFVRSALERAAARRPPPSRPRPRAIVDDQRASAKSRAYVDHDIAFHQHIAAMAGNPILDDLLSTARSLLRVWFEHAVDRDEDVETAIREHAEIADAIAAGDAAAAEQAMRRHMATATERILRVAGDR